MYLRELSTERIKSVIKKFPHLSEEKIINKLSSLMISQNKFDLSLLSEEDFCFVDKFTKDPIKQNIKEKEQLQKLNDSFISPTSKIKCNSLYFSGGSLLKSGDINTEKKSDIDFEMINSNYSVYFSAKYTGVDGGTQDKQFIEVLSLVEDNSLSLKARDNKYLALFLSGDFWSKKRGKYKEFICNRKISLIDFLKEKANKSPIIIFNDTDLPKQKCDFYDFFIKGKFHV